MRTGLLGGVRWKLEENTLVLEPKNGYEGTFTKSDKVLKLFHSTMIITRVEHIKTKGILHCKGKVLETMFAGFNKLKTADLSAFETSKAKSMRYMFYNCDSLESINLSSFDTSNVRDMRNMFQLCGFIETLDLSNFNTHKVMNMGNMFNGCNSLKTVNLSSFDTSKVVGMKCMFNGCTSLEAIDLSNFNTRKVKDMWGMFEDCTSLEALDLTNFDTRNVKDMSSMFRCCEKLKTLNIANFNTRKTGNMGYMFRKCSVLKELNLSSFNTGNTFNMTGMFCDCNSLERIDFSQFDPICLKSYDFGLNECPSLKEIIIPEELEKHYKAIAPLYLATSIVFFYQNRSFVKLLTKIGKLTNSNFKEEKKLLFTVTADDINGIGEWKAQQESKVDSRLSAIFKIIQNIDIANGSTESKIKFLLKGLETSEALSDIKAYLNGVPLEDILA